MFTPLTYKYNKQINKVSKLVRKKSEPPGSEKELEVLMKNSFCREKKQININLYCNTKFLKPEGLTYCIN